MSTSLNDQLDSLLDQATKSAIRSAESNYPRFLTGEALTQEGQSLARIACSILPGEDQERGIEFYTGTFVAAYHLHRKTMANFPTASHNQHSLK